MNPVISIIMMGVMVFTAVLTHTFGLSFFQGLALIAPLFITAVIYGYFIGKWRSKKK